MLINASIIDATSAIAMINATLAFNLTMTQSVGNYWSCTWDNISDYSELIFQITIWAIDIIGNVNQTESVIITIEKDLKAPEIYFINPGNGTIVTNVFTITVETIDSNQPTLGNVVITIYNEMYIPQFDSTMNPGIPYQWYYTWTNISDYDFGIYYIKITARDSSYYANINSTDYLEIIFANDTSAPSFTFPNLTNNTEITSSGVFNIVVKIEDDLSPPANGSVFIEIWRNPLEINTSMEYMGNNTWKFSWSNISSYPNGNYKIVVWARDSSLNGNDNYSYSLYLSINIGGEDGPDEFDLLDFITNPLIIFTIGSITLLSISLMGIAIKSHGYKSKNKEKVRINRLLGNNLCDMCEYFEQNAKFRKGYMFVKQSGQFDSCEKYKKIKKKSRDN